MLTFTLKNTIYIYIYICVCVFVCVCLCALIDFILQIILLHIIFYRYNVHDTILLYTFWFNICDAMEVLKKIIIKKKNLEMCYSYVY